MNKSVLMGIDPGPGEVDVLVNPPPEVLRQCTIAPGMGILYHYHPEADRRMVEGFPQFIQNGEGRLVIAHSAKEIVGYVVIARPDPQERWGDPGASKLLELGFVEVARGWRQRGIGRKLLRACFADGALDDQIVLATAYAWHWDLEGTELSKDAYRGVLDRFFGSKGFEPFDTDEPNIAEDPANRLLVRIGPRVSPEVRGQFLALLHAGQESVAAPSKTRPHPWKGLAEVLAHSHHTWNPTWWLAPWTEMWLAASRQIVRSTPWWLPPFQPLAFSASVSRARQERKC